MHASLASADPLAAKLAGSMLGLVKGSQHEVMEITAELDLSLTQLRTLYVLEHAEHDLAVNEIADRLGLSMAATGRAIDAMHRSGLVARREDDRDRRIKRITLTDRGTAVTERIAEARVRAVDGLVARLDPDEYARLDAAADELIAVLSAHLSPSSTGCAAGAPAPAAAGSTSPTRSEHGA